MTRKPHRVARDSVTSRSVLVCALLAALGLALATKISYGQPPGPRESATDERETLTALLDEEIRLAQLLLEAVPDDEEALIVMGNVQARHGHTDQAIGFWEKAADVNPQRSELYAKIANLASQTDQYETAIAMWHKVLEITPDQRGTRYDIANALMQLGDYEGCVQELEQEIELSGPTPDSCFLLGQAYQHRQEYGKAKQSFQQTIKLQPDHRQAYYGLYGVCVRLKQRDEAKQHLAKFKELKADHREAIREADESMLTDLECFYAGLANFCIDVQKLHQKTGGNATTSKVLETAFKLGRNNVVFLNRLAVHYSATNRIAGALALYGQIAQIDPQNASCHLNIGILALKTGRPDQAEIAFRKAIALAPDDYTGYQELVRLYLRVRRNLPQARELAQKAVDLNASGDTYYDLGLAHLANNDLDSALAALDRALEFDPTNVSYQKIHQLVQKRKTSQ
ncbi:MAG: tetratricopeptide repeat protein [Phycisphaerales bacterium]|nr:MAG: tetratricopeptide repeat protein [Phycisphaerales bacterium]